MFRFQKSMAAKRAAPASEADQGEVRLGSKGDIARALLWTIFRVVTLRYEESFGRR
jgi:hypothetical protein